jgi:hypothetical protein
MAAMKSFQPEASARTESTCEIPVTVAGKKGGSRGRDGAAPLGGGTGVASSESGGCGRGSGRRGWICRLSGENASIHCRSASHDGRGSSER